MSDLEGQQLGNYSLTRKIGEGAFAEVYVGEHIRLNTLAAIKVLLHTRLTRIETGEFLTEARTVANLDHRNIVRVLDFDVERDIPFLVLEYAPNGSLRQRHPRGSRVPLNTIVSYVKQIAAGLQYAHDKKLIHRDVKPENMLLKINNELLLSDFGLAAIARSTQSLSIERLEMAGTPYYMAPEQVRGRIRRASDQYALGVVVYEWISDTPPFTGSLNEIIAQHQFAPPPPLNEKVPGLPFALEQVVMKALAKEPENRYSRVQDFADALEQAVLQQSLVVEPSAKSFSNAGSFSEEAPTLPSVQPAIMPASLPSQISIPVVPAPSQSQTPYQNISRRKISRRDVVKGGVVIGVGAAAAAIVIDVAAHVFGSPPIPFSTNLPPHHATVSIPPFGTSIYSYSPNVSIPHAVFIVAWSRNGKRIASAWQDNTARVWDATTLHNLLQYTRHSDEVKSVAWSPDNTQIASGSKDTTVRVWDAVTGSDISHSPLTGHTGIVFSVAWYGIHIASASDDSTVKVWDVSTGQNIITYSGHYKRVNTVAWSPDGKYIASGSFDNTVKVWWAI